MKKIFIKNIEEMNSPAKRVAAEILKEKRGAGAAVLALEGDLGAGKTTFAQAFAKALGIKSHVTSPTFLIIRSYKLKTKNYKLFHHIDAYRLRSPEELLDLGFADLLKNPENIILIEWADKIKDLLPADARWLRFIHGNKEGERKIEVR
jgi:tRNA threonylcarbamoyladenosine biosynthesis protein TsaE